MHSFYFIFFQYQAGDFDIPSYGHQEVDRFGVLMDAWTHEAAFLECKREASLTSNLSFI